MSTTDSERAADPAAALRQARAARDALDAALRGHGLVLPSLDLDPLTAAGSGTYPGPLIDLGRVNRATALRLAEVLARASATDGG